MKIKIITKNKFTWNHEKNLVIMGIAIIDFLGSLGVKKENRIRWRERNKFKNLIEALDFLC